MKNIFFGSWESLLRTGIITVLAYVLIIFLLRISGKRTLSKMNAFDFIVTVALGSTLATVMLNKNVPLIEGITAFFLLIFLQFGLTWLACRNKSISRLIKATPSLLVYKGEMLTEMMRRERIDEDEIYCVLRKNGLSSIMQADAVILEADGSLTIITKLISMQTPAMANLSKPAKFKERD